VEAVMEKPMLISLPWVVEDENSGKKRLEAGTSTRDRDKETVQV